MECGAFKVHGSDMMGLESLLSTGFAGFFRVHETSKSCQETSCLHSLSKLKKSLRDAFSGCNNVCIVNPRQLQHTSTSFIGWERGPRPRTLGTGLPSANACRCIAQCICNTHGNRFRGDLRSARPEHWTMAALPEIQIRPLSHL